MKRKKITEWEKKTPSLKNALTQKTIDDEQILLERSIVADYYASMKSFIKKRKKKIKL